MKLIIKLLNLFTWNSYDRIYINNKGYEIIFGFYFDLYSNNGIRVVKTYKIERLMYEGTWIKGSKHYIYSLIIHDFDITQSGIKQIEFMDELERHIANTRKK